MFINGWHIYPHNLKHSCSKKKPKILAWKCNLPTKSNLTNNKHSFTTLMTINNSPYTKSHFPPLASFYILSSLLRGAQVMISSTLRIISAASVAESNMACLTLNASEIPSAAISPTCPITKHINLWLALSNRQSLLINLISSSSK